MEMQNLNALSTLQCNLIIQEYLPRDGTLEKIAYDEALSLLSGMIKLQHECNVKMTFLITSQKVGGFPMVSPDCVTIATRSCLNFSHDRTTGRTMIGAMP